MENKIYELNPFDIVILGNGLRINTYKLLYDVIHIKIKPNSRLILKFECENPVNTNIRIDCVGYIYYNNNIIDTRSISYDIQILRSNTNYETILNIPNFENINHMERLLMSTDNNVGISKISLEKISEPEDEEE